MALSAGLRIGSYAILAPLGAGGMGEVYRARDLRLEREVALKILPAAFAGDPERMARFEREAKVLASLNHPHIAAIYGVEEQAIVMELAEGPTLAERIAQGAMPLEEALHVARQIADALEYAHEKGVVHRDLKPANVKISPDGVVKVLDFGLAKAIEDAPPASDASISPTLTMQASRAGVILGTAGYMAPEQARGKTVDKRADIWSFGVVLYEMLTGQRPFEGETISDTLAAVLTREPAWDRVPAKTWRLLRKCLEKDPKRRLRDIGDVWELLEDAPAPAAASGRLPWAAAGIAVLIAAGLGLALWRAARPVERALQPLVRLDVDLGPDVSLNSLVGPDVILSPDGSRLAYVSRQRLYVRRLDQATPTVLAGTEGAFSPFFSPDGQWVAFFASGQLRKISAEGGSPIKLGDAPPSRSLNGSWGDDGNILAVLQSAFNLARIPSAGGNPAPITQGQSQFTSWLQVLPGSKAALLTVGPQNEVHVLSFADGRSKRLLTGGRFARYSPTGHLIYQDQGALFAVPFDLEHLEVHGTPVPVMQGIAGMFDFSRNGTLVYRSGGAEAGLVAVRWLDATGKTQALLAKPGRYARPRLSPDGRRLAIEVDDRLASDIWVYELQGGREARLTFDGDNASPVWTPDGRNIVISRGAGGTFWMRSDGGNTPQPLLPGNQRRQYPHSFTLDQKRLAFMESHDKGFHIWTVPVESAGGVMRADKPEPFFHTPNVDERHPSFSPDGRWLAYSSNESGIFQIYVRPFPGTPSSGKWQISNSGGRYPVWSHTSRELFYRTEDNQMMVAPYSVNGDSFVRENPRVWSETRLANMGPVANYDIAPDGKRIVAILPAGPAEQTAEHHVVFLLNFFDELRRRTEGIRGGAPPVAGK